MTVVAHDEAQSLKARIFSAAIAVFAEHGLSGARMEQIATEAQTTKRMVVYYFKSKEQLYQEVLQHVYARIRETEQQLGLENVPPVEALVRLVRWSVRYHATHADYAIANELLNCKIAEYAKAVVDGRPSFHIALALDVSPCCDCHDHSDVPIVPNVGMFASFDPVALDTACADKINAQPANPNSVIAHTHDHPHDHFAAAHPDTDWRAAVEHGEAIGLGTTHYELIEV